MKNLTIKKKIILWFSLALLFIILISEGITFVFANRVLNEDAEERLTNQVRQNAEEIEFFTDFDDIEKEENDHFVEYGGGWLEIDDDFVSYRNGISTELMDSSGKYLFGSSLKGFPENKNFTFTKADLLNVDGQKYYVFEMPLSSPDGLWLRGYISNSENMNLMYHFVRISIWLIPILAILALLGGYMITHRALRPVAAIVTSAEEIGRSGDLSQRLDIGDGRDEIHQLADTFNGMFDRLEKNFDAEKQFTSDVSHELRTPTAVIMAQSEYALELAETEEEYRESFEVIHRQSKLMNDMINQLLFFSRLEFGTQRVNMESVDISELSEQIALEQSLLRTNGITVETDIVKDVRKNVDVSLFTRMLNNLIGNAYKYGKHDGHIKVSLEKLGEDEHPSGDDVTHHFTHVLSVIDDGIGISEENLDRIWNRFFQADTSRTEGTEDGNGIGLGLSMVKQISTIMGFEIDVESSEGEGTAFHIYL